LGITKFYVFYREFQILDLGGYRDTSNVGGGPHPSELLYFGL